MYGENLANRDAAHGTNLLKEVAAAGDIGHSNDQ